jgi:alpha-1,3-glucosyltransferase
MENKFSFELKKFSKKNSLLEEESEIGRKKYNDKSLNTLDTFLTYSYFYQITLFINILSLLFKYTIGLYGYSGEGDWQNKFGDYEAQRNWMELTINLKLKDWYTNSDVNSMEWWPLDYPPMSGYYSCLWAYVFRFFIPHSTELVYSRGYESLGHKILMRVSVLVSDFIFFHIPVYLLLKRIFLNIHFTNDRLLLFYISLFLLLTSPILIIIDHGHFQYNCVMHGFFVLSVYFLFNKNFTICIALFACCINFKQMGLYYALPFPVYVIKYLFSKYSKALNLVYVIKYGVTTILVVFIIWAPWLSTGNHMNVISRIFPVWRGIFEDKVIYY